MEHKNPHIQLIDEYVNFMKEAKSVYISSINEYGKPEISYSPCVVDDKKNTYIIVSDLSKRTSSLVQERDVSLMFIEPEDQCKELYVRTRLLFDCSTVQIERLSDTWNEQVTIFLKKFGDIIGVLTSLADFKMFSFKPLHGTYVKGFGKAYTINVGEPQDHVWHMGLMTGEKM